MLQVEAADVGSPQQVQIQHAWSGPPQPEDLGLPSWARQAADLHKDDGAAHDLPRLAGAATWVILLRGMQPGLGAYAHPATIGCPAEWRDGW